LKRAANHARDSSNRFQHYRTVAISTSEENVGKKTEQFRESIGNSVRNILRIVV